MLWCGVVCCGTEEKKSDFYVMQCDTMCCNVLLCVAARCSSADPEDTLSLCVAVRRSVLQCVAVCCSVLQS